MTMERPRGLKTSWPKSVFRRSANPSPRRPSANGSRSRATPVAVDEPLVELETDKVTIEVPAPAAGVLAEIAAKDGETVAVGALLGQITEARRGDGRAGSTGGEAQRRAAEAAPAAASRCRQSRRRAMRRSRRRCARSPPKAASIPASVAGTGKDGRVTKGDMLAAIERAAARADAGRATGRRRAGARAVAAPTTPRARSACR